jgi:hypothetical protein
MRAEGRVVDEAQLDLLHQILRYQRPQQAQAERVLQRPPQAFDQRDGALLPDRPEPLCLTPSLRKRSALSDAGGPIVLPDPTQRSKVLFPAGIQHSHR